MSEGRWPLSRTFFNKTSIGGSDVCWEWQGAKTKAGYGQIQRYPRGQKKSVIYAHRFAYELATKTRLAGETHLHHTCENKSCVNPRHLVPTTFREHLDTYHRKTHCAGGHEFLPENTGYTKQGHRLCKICANLHARRRYWEKKAGLR